MIDNGGVEPGQPDGFRQGLGPPGVQDGGEALFGWMRKMRDESPVWSDDFRIHHVFRYDDVQRVMTDFETFSSDRTRLMPEGGQFGRGSLTMLDPPDHHRQRRLIGQAFTPKMVAGMEPRITELTDELLDGVDGDEFDLIDQLAYPLPVIVIAELLGIPPSDRELFRTWADGLMSMQVDDLSSPDLALQVGEAMREMNEYLIAVCRQRRADPQDDVITKLVGAQADDQQLSEEEVANSASLLLLAGHITSNVMLGNAVLCLDENPEVADELRADPGLIPAALEEVLRYRSPFMQAGRVTTTAAQVGGKEIPAGSFLMAWLLSASHDERRFPEPDRFDIHRERGRIGRAHV